MSSIWKTEREVNYSDPISDDFEALSRDTVPCRSLAADDLSAVLRIDRRNSGQDRRSYYARKFDEVLDETGVRVSLVAEHDNQVVGFVMARVDYGAFGHASSTAVIDTLGVDPAYKSVKVGHALMSQLLANLSSLMVDKVKTELSWNAFDLNGFLASCNFAPAQTLVLSKKLK